MKKTAVLVLSLIALIFCQGGTAALTPKEIMETQAEALNVDKARQTAEKETQGELLSFDEFLDNSDYDGALAGLIRSASDKLPGAVGRALRSAAIIIIIAIFVSVAGNMSGDGNLGKMPDFIPLVGALAIGAVSLGEIGSMIGMGKSAIDGIDNFSKALLPSVAAACTASGTPMASAARHMATMLFSDIIITAINRVLIPLVYAYAAICIVKTASGNEALARLGKFIKWAVHSFLALMMTTFVGYLIMSGVISGGADAATTKGVKFAISGSVPVVGSVIADAAETVLASSGVIRNALGAFGMIAIIAICIMPFLYLGANYIAYKLTAAVTSAFSESKICALVDELSSAFGLVMGMTGAAALLVFISLTSAVGATAGTV